MCVILQRQYCSVFSNTNAFDLASIIGENSQLTIPDINFGAPDIITEINKVKWDSAVGPDMFPDTILTSNCTFSGCVLKKLT